MPTAPRTHHFQLDNTTLTRLEPLLPVQDVLSIVLDVNPGSALNQGGSLHLRAHHLLDAVAAPATLTAALMDDLDDAQHSTRTRLSFLWDEHGHVQQYTVDTQLSLPESAHFGVPDLESLHGALESSPRVLIALASERWGRLFAVHLDTIHELYRLENVLEPDDTFRMHELSEDTQGPPAESGAPQHRDAQQDGRFQHALLTQVQRLLQVGAFEHLLVSGSVRGRAGLLGLLDANLERVLAGDLPMISDASVAEILGVAEASLSRIEQEAETLLLEEARQYGTVGAEATLEALQQGRVGKLLVAGGGAGVRVWQDSSGFLFAELPNQGLSPLTGGPVVERALRDVLAALRERFGLTVRFLIGPVAERLIAQFGGLAGVPRT